MAILSVTMPAPPPLNNLFSNKASGGRVPSKKYTAWKKAAGWHVKAQCHEPMVGPVSVSIVHCERSADLDNLNKAALDLLVSLGLLPDDGPAVVRELHCSFGDVEGCLVTVTQIGEAA